MKNYFISFSLVLFLTSKIVFAQWSSDPSQNNQGSFGVDGAAVPYVATHPCGNSYISWFAPSPGGDYYPWIQKVDVSGPKQNSQVIYNWSDNRLGGDQIFAQNICENGNFSPIDDSFEVDPDTLFFLTADEIFNGKVFHIINPHDYSLDIQYIQQLGSFPPGLLPWFTIPWYNTFPVNIAANDSLEILVKWPVLDESELITILYDTLHINTNNHYGQVIIAVDSVMITMGINKTEKLNFSAFPNPFFETLNIRLNVENGNDAEITIFNTLMQPVRTLFADRLQKGSNHLTWDGTDSNHNRVSPGVYFISVHTTKGQQIFRVIRL